MKSIKGEGSVNCPHCEEVFDAEFWTLIRGDVDLELKDSLIGGELNLVSCPSCGNFFYHERTIIYFDPTIELLAFVWGGREEDFEQHKTQMKKDFELLKNNLTSLNINYQPFYLKSLAELKAMIEYEDFTRTQSEVIATLAAENNFKVIALKPSVARVSGFPFYAPIYKEEYTLENFTKAAQELLKQNSALNMLKVMLDEVKKTSKLPAALK
jgi:uncharacterized C2H2 Zn-finger protein